MRGADTPDILVFPPLLLGGAMVLGFVLDRFYPVPLLPRMTANILGVLLFLLGASLALLAQSALRRVGTHVSPHEPTLALATDGPYRWTRNPIYLAGLCVYLGVAFFINGLAALLVVVPLFLLLQWGIVMREEHYLGAKFGEAYRAYQNRVRRWL